MTDKEQIQQIALKVLDGSASDEEKSFLEKCLEVTDKATVQSLLFQYTTEQTDSDISLLEEESRGMVANILGDARLRDKPVLSRTIGFFTGKGKYRSLAAASVAACIIICVLSYLLMHKGSPGRSLASVYKEQVTRRGETSVVVLPDGSKVYLNAGSHLKYPPHFSNAKRQVFLDGEAFFEVARDSLRPFIVDAGNISTLVLGTSFNIRAYIDEPDKVVSVKTGKVKVSIVHPELSVHTADAILVPARQAVYSAGNADGIATEDINPADIGAWSGNKLIYNNKPLAYILHELERVYNIRFSIWGEQALSTRYTLRFDKTALSNTLNDLSLLASLGFTQQDSVIKVTVRQ